MLILRGLHAGYGAAPVLRGVDLQVAPGEVVALLGRNGAGRSTLLKAIMGLVPAQGAVSWRGRALAGLPTHRIARLGLGWVPEQRDVFPRLTVEQNLLLGLQRPPRRATPRWTLASVFERFPALAARRAAPAGVLSGGEQQQLALGRTLLGDPELLLVDEPTEGLAPALVAAVAEVLRGLKAEGLGLLLVEQKLAIALDLADRCAVLGHGRVVFDGPPAALRADAALQAQWLAV